MKFGTLVVLLAAILIGGLAAYFAREIITGRQSGPMTTLVVASQPLAFGTEITEDNVTEIPWSSSVVSKGTFSSKAELFKAGRRVALSPVEANEPVLASRITGPGQKGGLSALIDPGMRAVTVRVDDVKGVGGFVTPGDRVDVVLTRTETRGQANNSYTDVLLQNVKVLGVDQIANASQEKATVAKAVTVEVSTEQAQKLVLGQSLGALSLVLRKAGAASPEATRRVTAMDLGLGEYVGTQPEKDSALNQRLSDLEARMNDRDRPAADPPVSAAPASHGATVVVYHGEKPEEYNVYREAH